MRYYKVTLLDGEILYHESKGSQSDALVLSDLVDKNELDPTNATDAYVEEVTEEEYEENCY